MSKQSARVVGRISGKKSRVRRILLDELQRLKKQVRIADTADARLKAIQQEVPQLQKQFADAQAVARFLLDELKAKYRLHDKDEIVLKDGAIRYDDEKPKADTGKEGTNGDANQS